ncbi:MAG: DUF2911 domain-containing protein, partial [Chitinophagales bacterium]
MKRFLQISICLIVCALWGTLSADAQLKTPAASPMSKLEQTVGLTDVMIEYSRPSMKGRTIFGDLVPYGTMWRTGANASTKVSFSEDVTVGGKELKKGDYALYTIPGEAEWTIVFHSNLDHWGVGGSKYNEEEDAVRFTVKPSKTGHSVETFTIDVSDLKNDGANINLKWADTMVTIPVAVGTTESVIAAIDKVMAGPSWYDYYQSARFYTENGQDMEKAHEWMAKSVEMGGNEKFWVMRQMSLIQAKMKKYKDAIATAEKSLALAQEAKKAGDESGFKVEILNKKKIE